MNLQDLSSILSIFTVSLGANIFLLTFIFFYIILSIVILRQTQLMTKVLDEVSFSPFLNLLALFNLLAAIGVFILAIIFL